MTEVLLKRNPVLGIYMTAEAYRLLLRLMRDGYDTVQCVGNSRLAVYKRMQMDEQIWEVTCLGNPVSRRYLSDFLEGFVLPP